MQNNNGYLTRIVYLLCGLLLSTHPVFAEDGVTETEIVIGGVMDTEGRSSGLGLGMKAGIEAALKNQTVAGKKLRFIVANDSYTPDKTVAATNALIQQKVFAFAGNVGTPTTRVALPILAENKIPAIGFFTGAGLLRPGEGDVINYRASYVQETQAVIDAALKQGIEPGGICAYVQNDAYGMAGITGIRKALEKAEGTEAIVKQLDEILKIRGENPPRNGIGPAGVYTRNTFIARSGYDSLKEWEIKHDATCQLIITVGAYEAIARFIAYAAEKNESWIFSAVSFTGAENFAKTLNQFGINDRVIMTQVVPLPSTSSDLPIVQDAQSALGSDYGYVSQEGYIVGQLLLYGLRKLEEDGKPITRANLLSTYTGSTFDLGGLEMDFTDDNQGSDFVTMTALSDDQWVPMQTTRWNNWLSKTAKAAP